MPCKTSWLLQMCPAAARGALDQHSLICCHSLAPLIPCPAGGGCPGAPGCAGMAGTGLGVDLKGLWGVWDAGVGVFPVRGLTHLLAAPTLGWARESCSSCPNPGIRQQKGMGSLCDQLSEFSALQRCILT